MKLHKILTPFLFLILFVCGSARAGDSTFTLAGEYDDGAVKVYHYQYKFAGDSLAAKVSNIIPLLTSSRDSLVSFSFTASGTVKNFKINTYLTNLVNSSTMSLSDTAKWNLLASYDTTGLYTNKPVNKVIVPRISALSFAGLAFKLWGAAGNRKDVIFDLWVQIRKE